MLKQHIIIIAAILICFNICAYAENNQVNKVENNTEMTAKTQETVENILNDFENNSDEVQEKVDKIIEKNAENFFVKLFKNIINAISALLDSIFELASEATKIR